MKLTDAISGAPLSLERITEEIKKLCLKSSRPSLGFRWLENINRLDELFPELGILCRTPQRPDYHPEGSVFEHTMQAMDAAAAFQHTGLITDDDERFLIILAAMCHDLGKATTTTHDLKAHGHDSAGVPISIALLKRITNDQTLIKTVGLLVQHHLAPFTFVDGEASIKAYKRLAAKLAPLASLRQLGLVALADRQGRNSASHEPLKNQHELFDAFMAQCEKAAVTNGPETPVLLGRDLLDTIPAGPQLGRLLKEAYTIQIEESIKDPIILRQRVLKQKS
jgi:tRNA nucleotidyltransferase (CCA-adding enzyme)